MLLALAMEQPGRLLSVFKTLKLVEEPMKSLTGSTVVDEVIKTMTGNDLAKLLKFVRDWNSNAKTSGIAQEILFAIVKLRTSDELTNAFVVSGTLTSGGAGLKDVLDGLIPYTERHLARMERLV
jgi:U3 small nucleolar RNA-associated protein 13